MTTIQTAIAVLLFGNMMFVFGAAWASRGKPHDPHL